MFDRPDPYRLRRRLARREPWRDVSGLSDDELLDDWLRDADSDDVWGKSWFDRPMFGGTTYGGSPALPVEPPAEDLAPKHFIAFEVQDGAGDPYPGLSYSLRGPEGELEEGTLPDGAQIRRDDVPSEDWALTIKSVLELAWGATVAACGEQVELRGRVTGHADGTAAEIRIFRELRETDDDAIETLSASVESGHVVASWTYDPSGSSAIGGAHAQLRFRAELHIPDCAGRAKTQTAVVFQLPAIRAARWSTRRVAPGSPVTMRVAVDGIPDGSPMTIEVFKQRRDGSQQTLDTFEGLPVAEGAVVLQWTYDSDVADPLAPNEAECFFVATSEVHLEATRVSGPLWVSRAVGRRTRRKKVRARRKASVVA